jgi:16S rRNA (cytidine1402-2'-O)-methyltransferase
MARQSKHAMREGEDGAGLPEKAVSGGTLYVVATPIGNLEDLTARARAVLAAVDVIAAEDTRHTRQLLAHYGIGGSLTSLHEHNEAAASGKLVARLAAGQSIALVSDAGTPCISDPGARLVAAVRASGHRVVPIPGANAAIAALSASGIEGPFLFCGFLPAKAGERRHAVERLSALPFALVFYEAPHRVVEAVHDLADLLGAGRKILIARELTKKFESIHDCMLGDAEAWLAADADRRRGEFVLVVTGAAAHRGALAPDAEHALSALLAELPVKQAVRLAAAITGAPRNPLYARALELAGE